MSSLALVFALLSTSAQQSSSNFEKEFKAKDLFELKYVVPQTTGKTEVQKLANSLAVAVANDNYKQNLQWHNEDKDRDPKAPSSLWASEISGSISVNRADLVSIILFHYSYMGGAHPNQFTSVINVGLVNGKAKRLVLKDIIKPEFTSKGVFETYVMPNLNQQRLERGGDTTWNLEPELTDKFALTPTAITWIFDPYQAGSYAEGEYTVKLFKKDFNKQSPFQKWLWN